MWSRGMTILGKLELSIPDVRGLDESMDINATIMYWLGQWSLPRLSNSIWTCKSSYCRGFVLTRIVYKIHHSVIYKYKTFLTKMKVVNLSDYLIPFNSRISLLLHSLVEKTRTLGHKNSKTIWRSPGGIGGIFSCEMRTEPLEVSLTWFGNACSLH